MQALERKVFYLNVSAFPIEVERVLDPCLKKRPVIMAPLHSDRSLIWEASSEARERGVEKGMSLAYAKKLCSDAKIIAPRPDLVNQVNRKIEQKLLSQMTPVYEMETPGHAYLDLTGFEKIYGKEMDIGKKIFNSLKSDFSIIPTIGSATNKLVSKVAAKTKQDSILCIEKGREELFLTPLPITSLPFVREMIQKGSTQKDSLFDDLNIQRVGDLLSLSSYALEVAFGRKARMISDMARGIDYTPVNPPKKEKAIYEETYLPEDTNDLPRLQGVLLKLLEAGVYKLRKQELFCSKICISLRYIDYKYISKEKELKIPSQYTHDFEPMVMKLFHDLFKRRVRVQFLSIGFMDLIQSEVQLSLFDDQNPRQLTETMDLIKNKFGVHMISFAKERAK